MSGSRAEQKARWFRHGVEAFLLARPGAPPLYVCPLCIRAYDSPDHVTFEDVPPKSVGGRKLVLTCPFCNHRSGQALDVNIKSGRDIREVAAGARDLPVDLTMFGNTISARMRVQQGKIEFAGVPEKSNPQAHRSLFENLDRSARTGSKDWQATVSYTIRHDPWLEAIGWLRVAYLFAFAALGYNFVLRSSLEIVRQQIQRPDERILPEAMKHAEEVIGDSIAFVHTPHELHGILVSLGTNLFLFPGFSNSGDFYQRVRTFEIGSKTLQFAGLNMELPRARLFRFDYEPELMRLAP